MSPSDRTATMPLPHTAAVALALVLAGCALPAPPATGAGSRPNIVLILADDLGFSDIGCYGGEIRTPNLDRLARDGVRLTQFYNTGRCCPTRASLLTGLHPHQAGIGHMTNVPGRPRSHDRGVFGYRGFLNRHCVTLAEVLRPAGYRTLMAGKWHVGLHDRDRWPLQRGFDRFYGILTGASNYFAPGGERGLTLQNEPVDPTGADYYTTDAFTTHAIDFVRAAVRQDRDQPFFLYLAYTAPHWPLQAPRRDIDRYRGRYLVGWEKIRQARHDRMVEMGIVRESWGLSQQHARAWASLSPEKQRELDLRMAIYAAQVDRMDQNIGRLVTALAELGELDDTVLVFLADNGGCAEGGELGGGPPRQLETREGFLLSYGRAWANVSNTPFRRYKHWVHEGGMATPCIVHWPAGLRRRGQLEHQPGYLPDLMATCVALSGASYPERAHGNDIPPLAGVSLLPAWRGERLAPRQLFWEHEHNRAMRDGRWKLVSAGRNGPWELYDLDADRTELHDLAAQEPARTAAMAAAWESWAYRNHVWPDPRDRPRRRK